MAKVKAFYTELDMSWDELLLSFIFQPAIAQDDWRAFKRTLFDGEQGFWGTLVAVILFLFLLVFFQQVHCVHVAQALRKSYPHIVWARPTWSDAVRFVVQSVWLVIIQTKTAYSTISCYRNLFYRLHVFAKAIVFLPFVGINKTVGFIRNNIEFLAGVSCDKFAPKFYLIGIALLALAFLMVPFDISTQTVFILMLWLIAMIANAIGGQGRRVILIALSLAVMTRYLWWRYASTLNIDSNGDLFFGGILICAETYVGLALLLGFLQIAWPLQRKAAPLPVEPVLWPSVDIFISTQHDDVSLVKLTALAALSLDWPDDKLNVYILDDGKSPGIQEFAEQINVGYIRRADNLDAKEGVINHALTVTSGDYLAVFACGDVPARSFLQLVMGGFLEDEKLALIQTPHGIYPAKNSIGNFYDGDNGLWNACFFSGSCTVLRRTALLEVGGLAADTVSGNAQTALRLHRKGYVTASVNLIQAARLPMETLSDQIGLRIGWANRMAQIFRFDNPLLWGGLNMAQRLAYASELLYLLGGVPRLIFLLAPLGFLLGHQYLIYAPAADIALHALPAIVLSSVAVSYLQGRRRYSFWGGISETVLALHVLRPVVAGLLGLKFSFANATIKGGLLGAPRSKSYLCLIGLNLLGAVFAGVHFFLDSADERAMVLLYFAWVAYNLVFLGIGLNMTQENKWIPLQQRIADSAEVVIQNAAGRLMGAVLKDYSDSRLGLLCIDAKTATIERNEKIYLSIMRGGKEFVFPARVANVNQGALDVLLENLTLQQQLEYIQCTYAYPNAWQPKHLDRPSPSLNTIIMAAVRGYIALARKSPKFITKPFLFLGASLGFIKTLLPKNIQDDSILHKHA